MRRLSILAASILIAAACTGDSTPDATTTVATTGTTTAATAATTTLPPTTIATTTASTTLPVGNAVADGGADRMVARGEEVRLDGRGSHDPDGADLTYTWSQVYGPDVTGGSGELVGERPRFNAPHAVSTLIFELVVDDGAPSRPDEVRVDVFEDPATAVFVDPDMGSDDEGDGSRHGPYATIRFAIQAAPGHDLYLRTSNTPYDERTAVLQLAPGVSIYGGYGSEWVRDPANRSIILGASVAMRLEVQDDVWVSGIELRGSDSEDAAYPAVGIAAVGEGTLRVEDTVISAGDVADVETMDEGRASAGLVAAGLRGLEVVRTSIESGLGGRGADGTPAPGSSGVTATNGRSGGQPEGGAGSTDGEASGGDGGDGGGFFGGNGQPGGGTDGGSGGTSGSPGGKGGAGGAGGAGGLGGEGGVGFIWPENPGEEFRLAGRSGSRGDDGASGAPGSGGGGGFAPFGLAAGGGGGGGHGGTGGIEGGGGSGGGASVGIAVLDVGRVVVIESEVMAREAGAGGNGGLGAIGSKGGGGGSGGDGACSFLGCAAGEAGGGGGGGGGGAGGAGGDGGAGAGGPAIGLFTARVRSVIISGSRIAGGIGGAGGAGGCGGSGGHFGAPGSPGSDASRHSGGGPGIAGGGIDTTRQALDGRGAGGGDAYAFFDAQPGGTALSIDDASTLEPGTPGEGCGIDAPEGRTGPTNT